MSALMPLELERRLDSLGFLLDELGAAYRDLGAPLLRVAGSELREVSTGRMHAIIERAMHLSAKAQTAATTARAIHRAMAQDPNR
jgi:hypothetical protein